LDVIVPVHRLQAGIGDRVRLHDVDVEKRAGSLPVVIADLPHPHVNAALAALFHFGRAAHRLDHSSRSHRTEAQAVGNHEPLMQIA